MKLSNCLIIVDVQKGFVSENTEYVLPRIEKLLKSKKYDKVIATRFTNEDGSPYKRIMDWHRMSSQPDTDLVEIVEQEADLILDKNVYTAVNDTLIKFLEDNKITEIHIAGIDLDCCVMKTAVDLFEKNYDFKVLTHYSATNGGEDSFDAAIVVMKRLISPNCIIKHEL